ncbi:hypothetical protein KXD93_24790 [Mucilaginibacter sp. BJC16-A38]|uniref:hypothetical protein n=1 Tax=Mucilaginibacter phenanthrenivorans TaxID=1234842 RepID=UPI002157E9BA|nr:hypothetical protein [Mucilaginibacter phenanthrenivorans]MCR8560898.1 hypothetical protein [Mucilaginibacter phenanthrenivorans]
MKFFSRLFLFIIISAFHLGAFGQNQLKSIIAKFDTIRARLPIEKLYLQTDKANYVEGDTIWFKAYLLDADYLTPSVRSGLLYAELDDNENICVKRMMLPLVAGITWGNLAIDEKDIPEGSYTLRAYTSWMRNFGEDYVFSKSIYIASSGNRSQLVVAGFKQDKNNIRANILLTDLDSHPVRLQDLQLRVLNGRRTLFKKNMATGIDGRLDLNFILPDNTPAKHLAITAKETIKGADPVTLTIPVILNRTGDIDLQFMPEGGNMVSGIASKIGFKAIGEDGKGVDVGGAVYNSKQQQVASFTSGYKGIGAFELVPQSGETYTARITSTIGANKSYPLPAVSLNGTTLQLRRVRGDSIEVRIITSTVAPASYFLIGQSRGVPCYAAHIKPKEGAAVAIISPTIFPAGIVRFTLLSEASQPLNERIIYVDKHDNLQVDISPDHQQYAPHDSIAIRLQVHDKSGKPVRGSFSMAVTDDNQVKTDSLGGNIINNLLFTADLNGTVEDPGHYFIETSAVRATELDNLMLTQGWAGYSWKQVLSPPVNFTYKAEPEFTVTGRVTNMFNKPVEKSRIILMSKRPVFVMDTVTGKDGRFTFKGFSPIDTAAYVVQARRKSGSSFNMGLDVDEFIPPVFKLPVWQTSPWYVNSDTLLLQNRSNKLSQQLAEEKASGHGKMLGEVVIKDKRIIKDSKNLNGPGEADFILDEKDMEKAKNSTLYELLQQKFPGFSKFRENDTVVYRLKNHIVNFIFDGVPIKQVMLTPDLYMDYLTATDIKGIEIMYSAKYASAYDPNFMFKETMLKDREIPVYLEITTYSGNGAFMKKVPGIYVYKPLPFTLPKQFYRPKYSLKSPVTGTDQRSTIHWAPNIITDSAGTAVVSFYGADKPANYTIIVQGTDLNGQLGFAWRRILAH